MNIRGGFMGRLTGPQENYRLRDIDYSAFRMLRPYMAPYRWKLGLAVLLMLVVTGATLLTPYMSKIAVDRFIAQRDSVGLALLSLGFLALVGLRWLCGYHQSYLCGWAGQHIVSAIRRDLFGHVLRQPVTFHEQERIGQITSRLTHDVNALSEIVSGGAITLVNDILTVAGVIAIMGLLNWRLTLVTLAAGPVLVISMWYLGRLTRRAYEEVRQELAAVNTGVEQGVSGMRVVQSLSRESFTIEQFESLSARNMRANFRAGLLFAAVFPTMTVTNMLGAALVLGYGGYLAASGTITIGVLFAFLAYVNHLFGPLRELSLVYNTIQSAAAALDRIWDYKKRQPALLEPAHPRQPSGGFKGAITLKDVVFAYEDTLVFNGLNLHIEAHETVAMVGPTGAGKSTLAALLARLYDVQRGAVMIDGVDIRDIGEDRLRRLLAFVPQDVYLFPGSIRENIRYGDPDADDKRVEAVAALAQAHAFIHTLPDGYDTEVGEGGAGLSAGQRQLIALARALLTDPGVFVLDEATANVDAYTESLILEAIDRIRRGRTLIIIAHRFSGLRNADRIVVFENGAIAGQGRHEDLRRDCAAYRRLYERQWA